MTGSLKSSRDTFKFVTTTFNDFRFRPVPDRSVYDDRLRWSALVIGNIVVLRFWAHLTVWSSILNIVLYALNQSFRHHPSPDSQPSLSSYQPKCGVRRTEQIFWRLNSDSFVFPFFSFLAPPFSFSVPFVFPPPGEIRATS